MYNTIISHYILEISMNKKDKKELIKNILKYNPKQTPKFNSNIEKIELEFKKKFRNS
jgi:hypothetical protein